MVCRVAPVVIAVLVTGCAATSGAQAFSSETPKSPIRGAKVAGDLVFHIAAKGRPEKQEFYRIEVASEPRFEKIVAQYDMHKDRAGWTLGDSLGLDDIPDEYRPVNFEGIHYRTRKPLPDGTYWWRALKSIGGMNWEAVGTTQSFVVDTRPPRSLEGLRLRMLADGRVQLYWDPLQTDDAGRPDDVAGFRIYRYDRPLKRFPTMPRYLIGEVTDNQFVIDGSREARPGVTYFLVQGVDSVGNEEGRRRPAPVGSLDAVFNPPNADELLSRNGRGSPPRREEPKTETPPDAPADGGAAPPADSPPPPGDDTPQGTAEPAPPDPSQDADAT